MKGPIVFPALLLLFLHTSTTHAQVSQNCPLLGPNFPAPSDIGSTEAIRAAREAFPKVIQDAMKAGLMDNETTSFSISVFSATDNKTFYEQHFEAPGLNDSLTAGKLDDKTVYRIGSISKLFTTYALLARNGMYDFNQPITKYIPELHDHKYEGEVDSVGWTHVTVGALASHMAGIARDYGVFDLTNEGHTTSELENLGFPHLEPAEIAPCGNATTPCTREQYVRGAANQRPVTSTFNTPLYSNVGYVLLGYVLERLTRQSYEDAMAALILEPLGLNDTYVTPPQNISNAIKPGTPEQNFFTVDIGALNAAGSLYSTISDLKTLMLSILHSSLVPPPITRQWIKPVTFTSSPSVMAGAPWEIFRVPTPLTPDSNTTRLSDVYTKAGDLGTYSSLVAISPDHNIGFALLVAGLRAGPTRTLLGSLIMETWVNAAEAAAREDARNKLVGTYTSPSTNSTLILNLDPEKPGLGVNYTYRGQPFATFINLVTGRGVGSDRVPDVRLYPMGLRDGRRLAFKAAIEALPYPAADSMPPYGLGRCPTWLTSGALFYGGVALDDFEVLVDAGGKGVEVQVKGLRERLRRE